MPQRPESHRQNARPGGKVKLYRLFHRVTKQFQDVEAESGQEACEKVGWLIGDVWVRVRTAGQYSHGWSNVTKREVKHED
jgi:hypothetical protein